MTTLPAPPEDGKTLRVRTRARLLGGHVHVTFFVGRTWHEGLALGVAGTLVVRQDEWAGFAAMLDIDPEVEMPS